MLLTLLWHALKIISNIRWDVNVLFPLGCAPSPGAYDVKTSEVLKGPVFQKPQRFKKEKGNGSQNKIMVMWSHKV